MWKNLSGKLHFKVWMQSKSFPFLFSVQFANTVFWISALGYLWTQWILGRKEISTDENYNEALLESSWWCVNSSHRVTLMFQAAVHYHCVWGTWEGLLWIALRPTLIKEISSVENVKEAFWETSLWSVNSSHRVTAYFSGSSLLTLFRGICQMRFGII